jgi:hypothetical protein
VPVFARSSWDDFAGYDEAAGRGDRRPTGNADRSVIDLEVMPVPGEVRRDCGKTINLQDTIIYRKPSAFLGVAPYDLALCRRLIDCSGNLTDKRGFC